MARPLWEEGWTGSNSVRVSDGLFNVMLGSVNPIAQNVITGNSNLFLGITVGTDSEMSPRVQLGSVPFATQALTVPDGSITAAKLAADVSLEPPDGSITTEKIADGAVTKEKMAPGIIEETHILSHVGQYTYSGTSWADISSSDLSLSITSQTTQKWLIISSVPGADLSAGAPGWIKFDIAIDGNRVSDSDHGLAVSENSINYQGGPVTMIWVATLNEGTHTIRPQWSSGVAGDSLQTMTSTFTIIAVPL